jgi:hypothetical protein
MGSESALIRSPWLAFFPVEFKTVEAYCIFHIGIRNHLRRPALGDLVAAVFLQPEPRR